MSDFGAARVPPGKDGPVCGGCGHQIEVGEVFGWQLIGADSIAVGCFDCVMIDHTENEPSERIFDWRVPYAMAGGVPSFQDS
jgi:hypothetical protein